MAHDSFSHRRESDRPVGSAPCAKPSAVLSATFEALYLHGGRTPVEALLEYDVRQAYAVTVTFASRESAPVTWVISRALLAEGLVGRTGVGDVRLAPAPGGDALLLELRTSKDVAHFRLPTTEVSDFMRQTYELVAEDAEYDCFDIDAQLASFLP